MTPEEYRSASIFGTLRECVHGMEVDAEVFCGNLSVVMEEKFWLSGWYIEHKFKRNYASSLIEFITRPTPEGLETTPEWVYTTLRSASELGVKYSKDALEQFDKLIHEETGSSAKALYEKAVIAAIPPIGEHGGDRRSQQAMEQLRNTSLKSGTQTAAYTIARLQRDCPELHERVLSGELSANAAAIEAGFRKPPLTPLESLFKAWDKASEEERAKFLDAMKTNFEAGFLEEGR